MSSFIFSENDNKKKKNIKNFLKVYVTPAY